LNTKGVKPTPRYLHSAVGYLSKLYIIGGRNDSITGVNNNFFDEVCVFDTKVRYWYQIKLYGNPISHRWGACAECYGSKIYYFGGMSLSSYHDFTVHEIEIDIKNCKNAIESWSKDISKK